MIKLYLFGKYQHRIPFSYDIYKEYLTDKFVFTSDIEDSHFLVVSHYKDIINNEDFIYEALSLNSSLKILLFSEEPFWDSLNKINNKNEYHRIEEGRLCGVPVYSLTHENSEVFQFSSIPYFLTTDPVYTCRYILFYSELVKLTEKALLKHWKQAPYRYGSLSEKRMGLHFDIYDGEELIGLSRFRSVIAKEYNGEKLIEGLGWSSGPKRQKLPDWHIDKITKYHSKATYLSALENTNLNNYVTEKLYDSFAVQSFPVYYASENHRVNDIISKDSFLNVYGLTANEVTHLIDNNKLSLINAESYLHDANKILATFTDTHNITEERYIFTEKVHKILSKLINS